MNKRQIYFVMILIMAIFTLFIWRFFYFSKSVNLEKCILISKDAVIKPDYTDIVIPPNIAPLNFAVLESAERYYVKIYSQNGKPIEIVSRTSKIKIPVNKWHELLEANKGSKLFFEIYLETSKDQWQKFNDITNTIASEPIDSYFVYRFMKPIHNWWKNIGIYQRNLTNYDKSVVMHGSSFENGCLNCHSFVNNSPDKMTIGTRSAAFGSATILADDSEGVNRIGAKWGYTAWHPSGKIAAYSMNKVRQFFHSTGMQIRDVVDLDSAIAYYHSENKKVRTIPALSEKDRLETYPAWSPDGKYMYYCSAPILWEDRETVPPVNYEKVKYDLMRISYDIKTDSWGEPETVLSAEKTGMSILLPRISPDGRFLVFCMCQYGCFPIYQVSSDLYLMDLAINQYAKLDINSEYSESWHSWSANSRWLTFSSKRLGGYFTRSYFSYVDKDGKVYKPFLLPQKDPTYYDSLLQTYSVPEFVTGPIRFNKVALGRAARGPDKIKVDIPITGATPKTQSAEPWTERE